MEENDFVFVRKNDYEEKFETINKYEIIKEDSFDSTFEIIGYEAIPDLSELETLNCYNEDLPMAPDSSPRPSLATPSAPTKDKGQDNGQEDGQSSPEEDSLSFTEETTEADSVSPPTQEVTQTEQDLWEDELMATVECCEWADKMIGADSASEIWTLYEKWDSFPNSYQKKKVHPFPKLLRKNACKIDNCDRKGRRQRFFYA